MTIYFESQESELLATWTQYNGPIPEPRDMIWLNNEFYQVHTRMFTEKDIRLYVVHMETKSDRDKKIRSLHHALDMLDGLDNAQREEMIKHMTRLSQESQNIQT